MAARYSLLVVNVGLFAFHNGLYNIAATLKVAAPTLPGKLWMYKLEFLESAVNPSVAAVLALVYLGYKRWLTRPVLAVLVTIPVVTIALVWTNPGRVMIVDPTLVAVGDLQALEHEFPSLFVAYLARVHGALLSVRVRDRGFTAAERLTIMR